jgi:hypothetical protein
VPARIALVEPVAAMEARVPPAAVRGAPVGVPVVVPEVVVGVGIEPDREQDVPGARHLERRDSPELVLEAVLEVPRPRRRAGEQQAAGGDSGSQQPPARERAVSRSGRRS